MTSRKALTLMSRNLIANHVKVFHPEPYVDRWGRLRGNWLGLLHLLLGKANPMALHVPEKPFHPRFALRAARRRAPPRKT